MFQKEVLANKVHLEVEFQRIASSYGFSPKIHKVEYGDNVCTIFMDDLEMMCLADKYGDKPKDIPKWIWKEIRRILKFLYEVEGIEYIDVTPYNFIEKDGKVYIIDFGHAVYAKADNVDWFLQGFLSGENSWNPDYK